MLTLGGILYESEQSSIVKRAKFSELDYIRKSKQAFNIEVPSLTFKEIYTLDGLLPDLIDSNDGTIKEKDKLEKNLPELRQDDIAKYARIYRYFPNFAEANF